MYHIYIYIYVFYLTVYHCISYVYICQSRSLCITMTLPGISPLPIEAGLLVPSDALLVASTRHGTRVAVVVINEPHGVETQGLGFLWLIATKIGECIGQYTGNLIQMLNSYGIHEKYEKHHRTIIGKYWKHLSAFFGGCYTSKMWRKRQTTSNLFIFDWRFQFSSMQPGRTECSRMILVAINHHYALNMFSCFDGGSWWNSWWKLLCDDYFGPRSILIWNPLRQHLLDFEPALARRVWGGLGVWFLPCSAG